MLEWAGIGIGEEETFRLMHSIWRHAAVSGAKMLWFWGRIYCTKSDYWILEGELPSNEENDLPWEVEQWGQGVNKKVYWVTDNILEDWVQLPDTHPEHIKAARQIKHIMTGCLNSPLNTNPPFPGKERHYLRAQIARISHNVTIAPAGLYGASQDENNKELVI